MAACSIRAISRLEFRTALLAAAPPSGFSNNLAIANSGGPDSTCLLFLLARLLEENKASTGQDNLPKRLISLSIDHDLQASSNSMAEHASKVAKSLGVEHITAKLAWGTIYNPQKPGPEDKIEEIARLLRLKTFFKKMSQLGADNLAMGHHADDQVETMLMRVGRGTCEYGLAGMKDCRRWGMGFQRYCYGIEGMRKWIVRPLLSFPKDRILATCDENKLEYVQDPTNFQPELTTRNAIRHILRHEGRTEESVQSLMKNLPTGIAQMLQNIQAACGNRRLPFSLTSSNNHLRDFTQAMRAKIDDIERKVDQTSTRHRLPSPPGTFMMHCSVLQGIQEPSLLSGLIYRICRHVSPELWGNPSAELGRRRSAMSRLTNHLLNFEHLPKGANNSICVGSQVWWKLVQVGGSPLRVAQEVSQAVSTNLAWIASRQPPDRRSIQSLSLSIPIQELEIQAQKRDDHVYEVLYDNRFLVRIHWNKIPPHISSNGMLVMTSRRPWHLPEVYYSHKNVEERIHTHIQSLYRWQEMFKYPYQTVTSSWIDIEHIRPLAGH